MRLPLLVTGPAAWQTHNADAYSRPRSASPLLDVVGQKPRSKLPRFGAALQTKIDYIRANPCQRWNAARPSS